MGVFRLALNIKHLYLFHYLTARIGFTIEDIFSRAGTISTSSFFIDHQGMDIQLRVDFGFLSLDTIGLGLVFGALIPGKNVKIEEGTEMFLQVKEDTTVIALVQ